ncbi:MAG: hypothetical protein HC804_11225 [Anaerolineae bacterium]|nr:hypothetical protein [Anaerolineae bacterium]
MRYLLPLADLVTPNLTETAVLLNSAVPDPTDLPRLAKLARELHKWGGKKCAAQRGRGCGGCNRYFLRRPYYSRNTLSAH